MRYLTSCITCLALCVSLTGCASDALNAEAEGTSADQNQTVVSALWAAEEVLDLGNVAAASSDIVRGTVEAVGEPRTAVIEGGAYDGLTVVYRDAELVVTRGLKGHCASGEVISVRLLGGTVGDLTFVYEGEGDVSVGEDVSLFLTDQPDEIYPRADGFGYAIVYGVNGKFHMDGDSARRGAEVPDEYRDASFDELVLAAGSHD